MNLKCYRSPTEEMSFYKNIPMSKCNKQSLDVIRRILDFPIRILYRGPRPKDGRSSLNRQLSCLKKDATSFAVYADYSR